MRRRFTWLGLVVAMLLAAPPAFAQQGSDEGIGFGVQFGLTFPNYNVEQGFPDIEKKTGWLAGIWFGGNRNGTLGFDGEISYLKKKATWPAWTSSKPSWRYQRASASTWARRTTSTGSSSIHSLDRSLTFSSRVNLTR
jgi:hypothetical protein